MKKLIILLVVIMSGSCMACTSSETKNDNNISSEKDDNSAMLKTEDGNLTVKFNDIENYKIDELAEKIIIADKDDDTKFSTVYVIKSSDYDRYMGELKKEAKEGKMKSVYKSTRKINTTNINSNGVKETQTTTMYKYVDSLDIEQHLYVITKDNSNIVTFIANSHSKEAAEDIFFNLDVIME